MSKLRLIDPQEFILEGEFEKIRAAERTLLDEENVMAVVENYKEEYVNKGLAVGELNDGFLIIPTLEKSFPVITSGFDSKVSYLEYTRTRYAPSSL